ncbi:threonine aldolase family protein [Faecalibacter rhinopitheci]|uniref:Aminotransferase class V-fold PLP-dependent enzyme n=1 Tax=Faecalibacter rhinopitheci TaxID=2779678 RepID=A0A8J7FWE9_9FLAO|nr:aminotransferase class V-fold PLP-dependent enzyme [Faecalibacter rhinopitheci]MBF0596793.1 aminotransferase class V-fold PLP-dependent enzyme [Faecalibacter rhinopitheci]
METNLQQTVGYGEDEFCNEARDLIKTYLQKDSAIHFVSGGTQANLIVISSILKPHESVIAVESGHIAVHETGAIEATGHKVNTVPTTDGKITLEEIQNILTLHTDEHMVKPKLVYISNSTEVGSVYTKAELTVIYDFCQENNLYLFVDGARLGSALTSSKCDLTLEDLANLTDIFYIGGTKNGALIGEAIIINNSKLNEDFRYHIKQKGGMLAKGRLIGIQFAEMFKNDLFFEMGKHANAMAKKLAEGIAGEGYNFLTVPSSNQIFPILFNYEIERLQEHFDFFIWQKMDEEKSAIRLVTSWATPEEQVDHFLKQL